MPKKKKIDININHSELLEMIDDQIYKHLPISKIIEIIDERIALAIKPISKVIKIMDEKIELIIKPKTKTKKAA